MPIDPTQLYSPGDFTAVRNRIFQDSLDAVRNRFPIENDRYILSLENADYENPKEYTLRDQKKAVQNDQTLSWRIKGNWVLTDKASGKVISRSSRRAIMDVPYLTQRGTFIRSGTETTLPTQMRLVPGVYSRMGEDGLAKAHINARPGTGNTVMMTLNPAKPVFKVSVGTRNYDLFPLLKHLGATDEDIKNAWGKELFKVNEDAFVNGGGWYRAKTAAEVDPNDPWEKAAKDVLGGELNEDNTTATFGKPYKKVDKDLLLASSARLIGLAKGQHTGDNRDSMENQRFFGPADFISERIRLDAGGLAKNLLWRVSRYGDTEKIPSAPLSKYVHGLFTESNLAQAIEETNLLDAYKRATMVTRMGEGGIGSLESAPMSARLVHNSYKGFIDPIAAPECCHPDHLVFTKRGWKKIAEVTTDDFVACLLDGRLEYRKPDRVVSYDFDGLLYGFENKAIKYMVTGNHRMWCAKAPDRRKDSKRKSKEYEYAFSYAEDVHNTNCVMLSGGYKPLIHDTVTSKTITGAKESYVFDIKDWCEFLGWFVSEGCVAKADNSGLSIAQVIKVNPDNCARITKLLNRMGLRFKYTSGKMFNIRSKALHDELLPLGYCYEKYIPDDVFSSPEDAQKLFIEAALLGDGRKEKNGMGGLCTTSPRLAHDFERLLFENGIPCRVSFEPDNREERYRGIFVTRPIVGKELWLIRNGRLRSHSDKRSTSFTTIPYRGKVYCLTVPGGLFFTKIDGFRGFWTGNSLRVGLDTQIAHSARRGPDGLAYSPVIDVTTGQRVYLSTLESSKIPISFPEYRDSKDKLIPAMIGNDIEYLPKNQVRYFIPNGDTLFSTAADFVPIKSGIKAGRLLMAQKHQTQAMSIKDRMAPYVQSLDPEGSGKSVEEVYANILGAVRSDAEGKVVKVTKDEIVVAGTDGKKHSYSLYDNYPLNRKSVVNNTAAVKPGDIVRPGQLLASSSYTDKNGVAALGTQLRSAWLSYKGWNYLDAIVVSESAAKKLTSEHFYHEGIDRDDGVDFGRDRYIAAFPSRFNREQLSTIDANGAVKPGTIVHHGDPLVLAMSLRPGGPGTGYRALHKDISSTWEHEFPGEVTDVVEGKDGMRVYVKSWVPLQVGDKLATRFANKGTCAAVIPDEKMPRDAEGRPLEILFSPTGIVSRCFDEQHQLLTRQGWTPIAMVKGTDEIFAYNPRTGKGEFQRQIQPIHSSRYSGKIYMCSNKDVDFAVTEGHRMWALTDLAEGFREVVVDDIANTHVIIPASGNDLKPLPVAIQPNDWRVLQAENVSVHCPTVPSGYVFTRRNGVITCLGNTNSAALIEAALGKVAEKTGKRYVMPGFGTDLTAFAHKELADAGLTDREDVTDPDTGKKIKGIFTGNSYVTKFHHTSESKGGARATGSYTVDEQPASGGHDGAKTLGGLVLGAFAGHGASEVLKDMKLIKGQKNTDFWRDFKMGKNPVTPGVPLIYERFLASLEGSGIHITKDGDKTNVFAMTNGDVDKIARAELNSAATYDDKRFLPIRGGLFDPAIFGPEGNQWAKIKLDEPVLNPIMDDVVCNFLNLKKAELDDVLAGSRKLPNGMTGGEGLRQQLAHVNLDSLIENAKNTIRTGPPSRRDKAVKTLRWASAMKNHDATPDMFMLDAVPVLPPKYRRITRSGDLNMIADANYLYKQLLDSRDDLRQAKNAGLPDELLAYGRKRITDSFRAITGLADPTDRKLVDSDVTGLLKWVFGKGSPKMGAAQRLVIGGKLDVAGRSVINIDPRLDFDEIGMPEKQAWPLYRDFVIRKLVQAGMNPLQATRATVEHTPLAKQALIKAMSERPVIATRAPALHKFSVQAFKPKLVSGDTLKLNSVVEHAFNADFDGDLQINSVFVRFYDKSSEGQKIK